MHSMAGFARERAYSSILVGLCLVLSLSQGCGRSDSLPRHGATPQAIEQKLPFHQATDEVAGSEGAASVDPKLAGAPFRGSHGHVLPSGTLLTVQLEDSLSTAKVRAGDAFVALVAAPVSVDGDTLIERGTAVTGVVESERTQKDPSRLATGSGYFRLSLNSINLVGRQLPLQTSSLFARGTYRPSDGARVLKGRLLTFRLIAPVTLDDPNAVANRQPISPTSE
jgi:hypothetical protein